MAVAKTLLKATAEPAMEPGTILQKVNEALAEGNNRSMFVTVFLAILNLKTGQLEYANGGHNRPFLLTEGETRELELKPGIALGAWPGSTYRTESVQLAYGDALFCYTDGVNEAFNGESDLYGMERLKEQLKQPEDDKVEATLNRIMADVSDFSGDTPQSDDITMLMVKRTRTGKG